MSMLGSLLRTVRQVRPLVPRLVLSTELPNPRVPCYSGTWSGQCRPVPGEVRCKFDVRKPITDRHWKLQIAAHLQVSAGGEEKGSVNRSPRDSSVKRGEPDIGDLTGVEQGRGKALRVWWPGSGRRQRFREQGVVRSVLS